MSALDPIRPRQKITVAVAAAMCGMSEKWVRERIDAGDILGHRAAQNRLLVDVVSYNAYWDKCRETPSKQMFLCPEHGLQPLAKEIAGESFALKCGCAWRLGMPTHRLQPGRPVVEKVEAFA